MFGISKELVAVIKLAPGACLLAKSRFLFRFGVGWGLGGPWWKKIYVKTVGVD